jgi:two-component system sensor histidine kinase CpxA
MKPRFRIPLLAKMLGWLLLHLLLLALLFGGFVVWQLQIGLDSLLSGSTGERLRTFGEVIARDLRQAGQAGYAQVLAMEAEQRGVELALWRRHEGWMTGSIEPLPEEVKTRLEGAPPPPDSLQGRGRGPGPEFGHRPRRGPGAGPGREPGGMHPPGPPDAEPADPAPSSGHLRARPLFLTRSGGGYWAAVDLPLFEVGSEQPLHGFLVIRSRDLAGAGLFFEIRPWLLGGIAVLGVSVLFWIPFAYGITRYLRRLTRATERIAEGHFDVSLGNRRGDELGRLGRAIERMAGRLDHLVSGQKRFLGDVAHELCAPLARLRTGLGILELRLPEGESGRLESIDEEAAEISTLIEEVLAFSRAAGVGRSIELKSVDLLPVIEHAIGRECPDHQPHVEVQADLRAAGDGRLLERAIANVLRNSARYAGNEAEIRIQARPTPDGRVRLVISDNGPGVAEAEFERLFEPFYRPDAARAREHGGSGLGLAIVRTCVEACQGSVSARRTKGGGLAVEMLLAEAPEPEKQVASAKGSFY